MHDTIPLKQALYDAIEARSGDYFSMARDIWRFAELAYAEVSSSALQRSYLEKAGFRILDAGDLDTAVIAEYGDGYPHIGILGEYDALPGLSQSVCAEQAPVVPGGAGHGCGHNLLGTASLAAAAGAAELMRQGLVSGTVRYYGCPAEENGGGKSYMAYRGMFTDDAYITWHPESVNSVKSCGSYAIAFMDVGFSGHAAHAAAAHLGASALDALELTNVGINFLREHVPPNTYLHYAILDAGGRAPNIVQPSAHGSYIARQQSVSLLLPILERIREIAEGAALMTGTESHFCLKGIMYDYVPNKTLDARSLDNMLQAPLPSYTEEETAFLNALNRTVPAETARMMCEEAGVAYSPDDAAHGDVIREPRYGTFASGSSDVGDVSHIAPTTWINAASFPLHVIGHSWQATAAAGHSGAMKSMLYAAKVMAGVCCDLMSDPSLVAEAKREHASDNRVQAYRPYVREMTRFYD